MAEAIIEEKGSCEVSNVDIALVIISLNGGFLSFNSETESFELFAELKKYLESIFGSWTYGFSAHPVPEGATILIEF